MAKTDPLGLSFKSHNSGKDVSLAWDFFWILQNKKQKFSQYCFGSLIDNQSYEDGMRLDSRNMCRLLLTVPFLQRIFNNDTLRIANGIEKAEKSTWLDKFAGHRGDTFLWKDSDTGVISRTSSLVQIVDRENWMYGTVPIQLEDMYFPSKGKKSKTSSSNDSAAIDLIERQQSSNQSSRYKEESSVMSRKESQKEKENREFVHRAVIFDVINVIYRKGREEKLTFGKIPVNDDKTPPTIIDWSLFKKMSLTKDHINEFNKADILVEGKRTKQKWYKELLSCGNRNVYFFDRKKINLSILLEKEDEEDKEDDVADDALDQWEEKDLQDISTAEKNENEGDQFDYSTFNEFNVVWAFPDKKTLGFGRIHTDDTSTITDFTNRRLTSVSIDLDRLKEIKSLPLVLDEEQGDQPWYDRRSIA